MDSIPTPALPLLLALAPAFTRPTFRRAVVLVFAAVLTTGRRTIHNLLRTAGVLAPGDGSSYRRVLSPAGCGFRFRLCQNSQAPPATTRTPTTPRPQNSTCCDVASALAVWSDGSDPGDFWA